MHYLYLPFCNDFSGCYALNALFFYPLSHQFSIFIVILSSLTSMLVLFQGLSNIIVKVFDVGLTKAIFGIGGYYDFVHL